MPPQILAAAITLQALHGISDFATVQELRCDLRWKAACGLGLNDMAFDPSLMGAVEKAIRSSSLGLNPTNDGKVIRIPIPALTDERRKELSKLVHKYAEEGRNGIRQVRRDANDRLKKLLKESAISEDDERRSLDEVQKITDQHIGFIDDLQKKKDTDLLGK